MALTKEEIALAEDIGSFFYDPYGYVLYNWPWREPGALEFWDGPDTWQIEVMQEIGGRLRTAETAVKIAVSAGHGVGKMQAKSMIYEGIDGPAKWGDLRVGDKVWGPDGKPTLVVAVHENGVQPVYKVAFDDGSSTTCGADHLWTIQGRNGRRNGRDDWITISTQEIIDRGVNRPNGKATANQWKVPKYLPVEYAEKHIPVGPYTLGAWLGDGSSGKGQITGVDEGVFEEVEKEGYTVTQHKTPAHRGVLGLTQGLREVGVLHDKHVPDIYKYNTPEIRLAVLQGLMDTDGTVGKDNGCAQFTNTNKQLVDDVIWLTRSLGGKAKLQVAVKKPFYTNKKGEKVAGQPAYNVTVRLPKKMDLFRLSRKQKLINKDCEDRYLSRYIESIEYSHDEDCMCITVDRPDGLYLANEFIVTHNSALFSWLMQWWLDTRYMCKGVVTAGTKTQLTTKLWPELATWRSRSLTKDWTLWMATSLQRVGEGYDPKIQRIDAIPWSDENPDAFAGLHAVNMDGSINIAGSLVLYDEASTISNKIGETSEGAMTDPGGLWVAVGNPVRSSGWFFDVFKNKKSWKTYEVNAEKARMPNKKQFKEWEEEYGRESDFYKVRVLGQFPKVGSMQLIPTDIAERACKNRTAQISVSDLKVLSVDVARFGDDNSVILPRHGRVVQELEVYNGMDTANLADRVAAKYDSWEPDVLTVDGVGVGGGVVDRLIQLHYPVVDVNGGNTADDTEQYANVRTELYFRLLEWLKRDVSIPNIKLLYEELIAIEYGYVTEKKVKLERKQDLKDRLGRSPDYADSLALSFAVLNAQKKTNQRRERGQYSRVTSWRTV